MRVLVRGRSRDEKGAVAIMVAIFIVLFVVLAAFAVDYGMAYNEKRRAQTGVDAAALAAADEIAENWTGSCPTPGSPPWNAANDAAKDILAANLVDSTDPAPMTPDIVVDCPNHDNPPFIVDTDTSLTLDTALGGVVGVDETHPDAAAAAAVDRSGGGLRPLGVCSSELPASMPQLVNVRYEGHNDPSSPCDALPGNWRELDCPFVDNNGSPEYWVAIENGCFAPVYPVAGQQPYWGTHSMFNYMMDECPPPGSSDNDCLGGNTGSGMAVQTANRWEELLDETVQMPVIADPDPCPSIGCFDGSGNNSLWPIHRIVEVVVCGVHDGTGPGFDMDRFSSSGGCAGAFALAGDPGDAQLILNVVAVYDADDPDATVIGHEVHLVHDDGAS